MVVKHLCPLQNVTDSSVFAYSLKAIGISNLTAIVNNVVVFNFLLYNCMVGLFGFVLVWLNQFLVFRDCLKLIFRNAARLPDSFTKKLGWAGKNSKI